MKKTGYIPLLSHDTKHDFIFDIFDFLEQEGKIKIETIINNDEKGVTFKVNGFFNETGYKNKLVFSETAIINELKNYLEVFPKQEQKEILEKLKLRLIKIKEKTLVNEQCFDNKKEVISVNKFINCKDSSGYFSNYRNSIEYIRIWEEIYDDIYNEINVLIKKIRSSISSEFKPDISWEGTDTDLIELITALHEGGFINNKTEDLSRKDAFNFFEFIFNRPLKDAESKLSKAIAVRKEPTAFLDSLIKAFIHYRSEKLK